MARNTENTTTIDHLPSHRLLLYHVVSSTRVTVVNVTFSTLLNIALSTSHIFPLAYHYLCRPPNPRTNPSLIADSKPPRSP
jgi:hypothetical protein